MVEIKMRNGVNYIDKFDFLSAYPSARTEAYKTNTAKSIFSASGLIRFCSDRVISKLDIRFQTPTPPPARAAILAIISRLPTLNSKRYLINWGSQGITGWK